MFEKFSIKLLMLMLIFGLVPTIVLGAIILIHEIELQSDTLEIILTNAASNQSISFEIKNLISQVENIAQDRVVINSVKDISIQKSDVFYSQLLIGNEIQPLFNQIEDLDDVIIFHSASLDVIYSGRGSPYSINDEFLQEIKYGKTIVGDFLTSPDIGHTSDSNHFLIGTPIYSDIGLVGILVVSLHDTILHPTLTNLDDYSSPDSYLVNSDGYMVTIPKFNQKMIDLELFEKSPQLEIQQIVPGTDSPTKIFESIESKNFNRLHEYTNYLGIQTLGVVQPVDDTPWFQIIEIDAREAHQELNNMIIILTASIIIVGLVIIETALIFSHSFSAPINNLLFATKKIIQGDLNVRMHHSNIKEISDLSNSFVSMQLYLNESTKRIQTELKEKEDLKNALVKSTIIAVTDADGNITDVNDAFVKISKYSKEELIGQNHRLINSGHHPQEFFENMWITISNGATWRGDIKNRAKDGTHYWVRTGIVPVLGVDGKPNQYISIRTDITKEMEMTQTLREANAHLKLSEEKFRGLYENSPLLLRTIDQFGVIVDCNEMYAISLGYTKKEIIGSSIFDHVPIKDYDKIRESFETWKKNGRVGGREIIMQRKDGSTFTALITASGIYDKEGNLIGSNTSIIDLTEINKVRKKFEKEKLKRLTAIGELSARIAHDMRNPLSVIKNTVELIQLDLGENQSDSIQKKFARMSRAITRINHQVENVLDFVREKPLKLEITSLNSILDYVIDRINIPNNITIFRPEKDIQINCDFEKLEIVFVNLLVNAIQSMSNKGEIHIRSKEDESNHIIEIEDSGYGIPEDHLEKIFDPLFTTRQMGTGLGLPSCKTIVESHKGKIEVDSVIDKGTTFTITLPKIQNPPLISQD